MNGMTQPSYRTLARRQEKLEEELAVIKKIVSFELEEGSIRPSILRRWERISRDLDSGKGRSFASPSEMRQWLKDL